MLKSIRFMKRIVILSIVMIGWSGCEFSDRCNEINHSPLTIFSS